MVDRAEAIGRVLDARPCAAHRKLAGPCRARSLSAPAGSPTRPCSAAAYPAKRLAAVAPKKTTPDSAVIQKLVGQSV